MKTMNIIIFGLIFLSVVSSCDTREDFWTRESQKPFLEVKHSSEDSVYYRESIEDSAKINYQYTIDYYLVDDNNIELTTNLKTGSASFEIDSVRRELIIIPDKAGILTAELIAADIYENKKIIDISLECFSNLLPVGDLTITVVDEGKKEITLNGSGSYDKDSKYGGYIKKYRFLINNEYITETGFSTVRRHLPAAGTYNIAIEVMDSDGAWSERVTKEFTITK